MRMSLQLLKHPHLLRAAACLLAAATAGAAWMLVILGIAPATHPYAPLAVALAATTATAAALWRWMQYARQHTRKVLFLLDAIANNDYTLHFTETDVTPENRLIHHALNRVAQILHRVKNETAQREKYYELILECIHTGIVVLNSKGAVYQKNNEALRLLGMDVFTHVKQLARIDNTLMERLAGCRPGDKIQVAFCNERDTVSLSVRVSGITIRQEPLRILALNDINHELDEKELDSWARLTRVLTHEIMNSVTPITSLSDTLLQLAGKTGDEEIRLGLETIRSTGQGLLAFVESYRKLTRIPTPEPELFYVKPFIERMVRLAQHQFPVPDTHISFHTEIVPDDLILHADEKLIAQVLTNLLKNAIQVIGEQSDKTNEGRITIRAYCDETEAVFIAVSNNGPSIPPQIAEHIFVPFFSTRQGGSGIGLSISRQIMRLSGGSIALLPGNETTFLLKFD